MELVYPNERKLFRIALVLAIIIWAVLIIGTVGIALIYIGLFFLIALFAQSGFITHVRGNGVRITEAQYPDLYQRLQACCEKVGLETVPEAYLLRTDFFNALATRFLRRHYVVLFTDVVDALQDNPEAVNFYIGHELGHIHRNHIRWGWILAPVLWLPVLGSAYRRAEEYTCDRYGNACCATREDTTAALAAVVAGDTRWKDIDVNEYLRQVDDTGGFFMSLNELTGEYPWLCKRMSWVVALREGREPDFPKRSFWAGLLSVFIPSIPGGAVSLILVVAMIGILAAVALPAYQSYIETAELARQQQEQAETSGQAADAPTYWAYATPEHLSRVLEEVKPLREAVSARYEQSNAFVSDLTELGMDSSFLFSEQGGMPIAIYNGGVIGVTLDENKGAYFVLEPQLGEEGGVQWICYGQNVPNDSLPEVCRSP